MREDTLSFRCSIVRGGTSKGLFLRENELPPPGELRDKIILKLLGSPDARQIDGLGGANSLTSKVCIIGPSQREGMDVDYTFGQVSVDKAKIDWQGNCGNLSAAVGIYAVDKNYVKATELYTDVQVFNTNTNKHLKVRVPVKDGRAISEGDYAIPGVPGTGAKLRVEFFDPAGGVTGKLLPTGNPKDVIDLGEKGKFTLSVVDSVTPVVYLLAHELGLAGTELPTQVEAMPEVLALMEELRSHAAVLAGIVKRKEDATEHSPAFPKVGFVSAPRDYVNPEGKLVKAEEVDLVARLGSMQKMHRAYMIGGAVSTGAAATIPGTVIWDVMRPEARGKETLLIGQPYGAMEVDIYREDGKITCEGVYRTARLLMDGIAYIPRACLEL